MAWQLWVVVAAAAVGLVVLTVARLHHAQQVFRRIIASLDDPGHDTERDELATQRHKRARSAIIPHAAQTYHRFRRR